MFSSSLLLLATTVTTAQLIPRGEPQPLWSVAMSPAQYGNECSMYGDDALLICTGADGSTVALDPAAAGQKVWSHEPVSITNTQVFSSSGVAFGFNPTIGNYIIHAVSEGFKTLDPSYWYVTMLLVM